MVADEEDEFGDDLSYRTFDPRPVAGTQGLVPTAWARPHEQWGATQLQDRFLHQAKRWMTDRDYAAWMAVRAIGEAATRSKSTDPAAIVAFMRSDRFELAAYKGARLSFPIVGRPAAPAGAARRCALARLGIAAAGFLAPILRARYARDRQARDEMPNGLIAACGDRLRSARPGIAAADTIYVSNEKDNTITVVDGKSLEPVKTIPVGQRPRGILLSKDAKSLYICASDSDHIEVLDLASDKIVRTLPSGADPEYLRARSRRQAALCRQRGRQPCHRRRRRSRRVVTEIPVGVEPEGMGISPDGKYLVNTSETTNMAHVIDTATRQVVANILVDSRPRRAEWTADGAQFWVSAEIGGTVSVIDAAKREIVKRITFAVPGVPNEAIQPVGIAITRDRKLAFVALGPANRVAVIDAQSYEVLKYLLVGQRVWSLAFNPDQSRVYTTNGVSNDISVIDVASLKVIKSVPVGQAPWGVVSRP